MPLRFWLALALLMGAFAPVFTDHALAQPARPAASTPAGPPAELPDRTQANFGDWLVRCETQRPQG